MRKKASISFTRDDLLYSNINSAAENSSVLYMIESSTSSIIKTGTTLNPANITFYSYKKVGDGNYSAYTGWFKIQESINGINWTDKYTSSSSGEISKTYTPTSSAKFIKCILYINSGMTNQGAIISIGVLENGSSVTVSSIKYATNRDGSTQPPDSSFGTDVPTTSKGDWLWIKTTYSDNSVAISKSYVGTDGEDGKSIYVKNSTKVDGTTTIVLSDGEQDSTITIVDGEDGEDGQPGQPGEDGTNSYIHIAWANSADGTQDFSTSVSTGKSYIGVYYDSTSADSTRPQDYNWSLIKGSDGGNTAVVYLYQRNSSTAVIDWTDLLTYDFTDRSLVSVPTGWYKTVPSGTDPLYITSAIAYSKTSTDNIEYRDWSTPVILSENGEDGTPGSNGIDGKTSAIVYLYQRAGSTPQVPSENLTYTFSTGAVTGSLGNWVQQVPSGNNPIYIISALAVSNNLQYTIPGGTTPNGGWTTPRILAENGQDGKTPYIQNDFWYIDGTSTGIKALGEDGSSIIWKGESSSAPANPELNWCYRNTSDNKVYIYNGTNWVIMTQDGANGLDGYNQATLNIYRRTSSTLSSSDVPTSTTYNFSTKQIVGSLGSWTREIPEGTEQCWVSSAVAVSRTSTSDTLAWSEPVIFVKDGQDGNPGLNHATINLYKRIANGTSVTKPSTTSTYKFSDGTLSINGSVVTDVNGWSRDIPSTNSNSNPCYITTASVISSDDEVNITSSNWATPVKLVENGQSATQYYTHIRYSANSDGSNYDVSPSSSRPYIGVYIGTSQTAPEYGNAGWKWSRYLGADGTSVTITSITYAVTTTETQPSEFPYTTAPEVPEGSWLWTRVLFSDNKTSITKTKSGVSGQDGLNQASITLYQRAASAPSLPSSDVTYRFSDGKFKVGSSTSYTDSVGNWVKTLPSINSSHPEYVGWAISASAISTEAEDTIASSEWSGPNKIIENGLNQAIVRVYKRSATTPTTSDKPTSSMTYTFSTGALSPDNSNGWTKEIPQVDGNPCWVRSASVINTALTDTISTSDWGNAVKFVEDGKDGVSINNVVNSYLATDLSTGVTESTPGWTPTIQQITKDKPYLWNYETVLDENDNEISSTDPIIIGHFGVDGINGTNGVDGNSITSIDEFYQTTSTTTNPGSTGWQKNTLVVPDATNKYLWNYQVIHYSKTADQGDYTKARIIGVYGDRGPQGYSPTIGNDGYWYINGSSTNVKAEGEDGKGIKSVTLLSTSGNDKTYRITFDDDTTFDYTVTDGEDGKTLWGTSSTSYSTATKVITCSEITSNSSLYEGLTIAIKFNTNSTTDTLKLQVGGSSAKDVYINNAIVSSTNKLVWTKTAIMTFMYDGTKWILMDQPATYSADCSTAGTPGGKDVIINGCVIRKGTSILCKFTNKHASTTNTTLGVKSTSSDTDISYYSIYSNGVQVNNANTWKDNQTVTLTFNGSYWQAGIYTDDSALNTFLTQYATDQSTMQGLIEDSKLETYYQSSDPSNDWSTSNYSKHEGDLWYYTGTTTSDYKQNATYRWDGTQWQQQNVPKEVFDQIDGKKDIHYTNNAPITPPYNTGDLWSNGIDLRICINSKTTGQSYNISDWVLASNYIDSADATSIASTEANKTKTTETKTLYYISTSSSEPTGGSWVDETTITTADVLNKYLFVKIQNKINGSWVDATPSPGYQKSNLYNGIYTFANTVAGDSGLTTINGSKITTGRIQDSTGKNFIQIASAGTTTAGHLEFKDGNDWDHSSQGIQWNSSQGQLNIKGHITAKSLTIDGTGGSYNAYDAINISGYSIEITTEPATSISSSSVYLYPHLYHNGSLVEYILTSDTEPQTEPQTKTYYSLNNGTYTAINPAPTNPKEAGAYESVYNKFNWWLNDSSTATPGDASNYGRCLATYSDKARVTFEFDDGATSGGSATSTITVDPQKYITRISDTGIEIAPENKTGNDKLAINGNSIDMYRNNVSMLHLEDSSGRFGDTTDYTKVSSTNGVEIYRNSVKRAQFDTDINLYSSDQSQRLNLSTTGLKIYENDFNVASFGSSIELNTDFGGGISLFTGTEESTAIHYVGFKVKGIDGNNIFSIYDSDLGGSFNTINIDKYTNLNYEMSCQGWPLLSFIRYGGRYARSATSNTTTSIYYDGLGNTITPYDNRCYMRTGSKAVAFGKWMFVQLDLTIRDTTTITKNNYWALLSGAPAPATGYAALSAVAPARNYGNLSAYVTSAGSITVATGGADIPTDGRIVITGFYLLAEEAHAPDVVWDA